MCLGVPGQIIEIVDTDPITRSGRVNFGGIVKEINLAYVPEAVVGNYVVVHVGFAISIVDEEEAELVFNYLEQMGELEELTVADSFNGTVDVPTRGAP
jgi:hydrogenase expression/formation protein HypC